MHKIFPKKLLFNNKNFKKNKKGIFTIKFQISDFPHLYFKQKKTNMQTCNRGLSSENLRPIFSALSQKAI